MPRWVETSVRVRWNECDLQGHAYYGAFVPWFDLGREALALAIGIDYRSYMMMTTEFHARYLQPAKYLDELLVRAWADTPSVRLTVNYQLHRKRGGQLLARAHSVHALVNDRGLQLTQVPEFHEKFEAFLSGATAGNGATAGTGATADTGARS